MLGTRTMLEDTYSAEPMCAEYYCAICHSPIIAGECYIHNWHGDMMCGYCIEELNSDDTKAVFEYVGRDNIFNILAAIGELKYA